MEGKKLRNDEQLAAKSPNIKENNDDQGHTQAQTRSRSQTGP